jgi:probable phosphoglycerate mutase
MLKEKNIYIIRHGETDYNKKGFLQGSSIDASLNEKGIKQAEAFYESYKDLQLDKIYVSNLKRSYESIKLFEEKGVPIERHIELNEINWGILEGKEITQSSIQYFRKLANDWKNGYYDVKIPSGESPKDVLKRQQRFLDKILNRPENNILICMHGRAIRIFICLLLNQTLSKMDDYKHDNLGLYHIFYNSQSKPEMLKNNDVQHLVDI